MKIVLALLLFSATVSPAVALAPASPEPPIASPAPSATLSPDDARAATRETLRALLAQDAVRNDLGLAFVQNTKNPWNFAADITSGLKTSSSLEIVVAVSKANTLDFYVYPHYKKHYINTHNAKKAEALKDRLLLLSSQTFFYWATDGERDVYSGYTITLESGFPNEAVLVVLRSLRNVDKFVSQLTPDL